MADILTIQRECHQIAVEHGWWDDEENDNIPTKIALMHSELSEALEEYRDGRMDLWRRHFSDEDGVPHVHEKPEGFGVELADLVIRVFDLAGRLGLDMGALIELKMEYNRGRPHKHGGRRV